MFKFRNTLLSFLLLCEKSSIPNFIFNKTLLMEKNTGEISGPCITSSDQHTMSHQMCFSYCKSCLFLEKTTLIKSGDFTPYHGLGIEKHVHLVLCNFLPETKKKRMSSMGRRHCGEFTKFSKSLCYIVTNSHICNLVFTRSILRSRPVQIHGDILPIDNIILVIY